MAFFDGSARVIPFTDRNFFVGQYPGSGYPTPPGTGNWAVAGWGPNSFQDFSTGATGWQH